MGRPGNQSDRVVDTRLRQHTVLHVITGLADGGAEGVLARLVKADTTNRHHVVSLMDSGKYGEILRAADIPVHTLNMPRRRVTARGLLQLYQLVRTTRPDVIQTWMYHADLVGGIVARLVGKHPVVWGLRNTDLTSRSTPWSTRMVAFASARLSHVLPASIVSCSRRTAESHIAFGYCRDKIRIIPNGYDLTTFHPDSEERMRLRNEWNIPDTTFLLGMVARWDPVKDHATLLASLRQVQTTLAQDWRCALVGPNVTAQNEQLTALISRYDLTNRVLLLGPRDDIPSVMNALDLHLLSSSGEAFPNVVAEAMACGTPCVVTDVGDASEIVDWTGWVAQPSNPNAFGDAVVHAIEAMRNPQERLRRSTGSRIRISQAFSLERMVRSYRAVWDDALGLGPAELDT